MRFTTYSAAQYTLSAITYTRNVHFNWFNLRSPPENLLFKIMYNLPYFIPLGRIANSTLRECSEIVGFDPARVLKDRRACSEIVVRTLQFTYSLLTVHLQFTYSLLTEYLLNPTFSAHSTTIGRVLISSIQCTLARYVHYYRCQQWYDFIACISISEGYWLKFSRIDD